MSLKTPWQHFGNFSSGSQGLLVGAGLTVPGMETNHNRTARDLEPGFLQTVSHYEKTTRPL